jgi:gliding motility-associated lipoprotein GldH
MFRIQEHNTQIQFVKKYDMKYSKQFLSLILVLALAASLGSCERGPVYEKSVKMKNSTWDRFDNKNFEIPIEDVGKNYDITFVAHCTEQFPYDDLPFYVILTTPSGEERMREVNVHVRDNGKLIKGDKDGNSEARMVLWRNINMAEKGKCKISIENMIPFIQVEGIDDIGISISISK